MKKMIFQKAILSLIMIVHTILCYGQGIDSVRNGVNLLNLRDSRFIAVQNRSIEIYDVSTPRNGVGLFRIKEHPAFDSLMTFETKQNLLTEINLRCDELGKDSLLTADLFWVYRPYLDWLFNEDPHCRIVGMVHLKDKNDAKKVTTPAFDLLRINDTLLINSSLDPNFKRGDRLLSINGVEMAEYLKYNYDDRYDTPAKLMHYYNFSENVAQFTIALERAGEQIEVKTEGEKLQQVDLHINRQRELTNMQFPKSKCGYISIPKFYPNNSRLIKVVHKTIAEFKKAGLTNVILDLRMNPGGNGDRFDDLLSIFIDRPMVSYLKGAKVKGSKQAMEVYDFLTEDMIGQLVDLPKEEVVESFATNPAMYIDGMTYYVLMSHNTGSMAASFCNILQYNDAAKLVGEPLLHNALKYGEVIPGRMIRSSLLRVIAVSIVECDEYTHAIDGILMPDIAIPYVAADYLTGKDAMLDRLLEIIGTGLVN